MRAAIAEQNRELDGLRGELARQRAQPHAATDGEPARAAADDGSLANAVAAELAGLRDQMIAQDAEIARLQAMLDRARNEPVADLKDRFLATEVARSLTEEDQNLLFGYVVKQLHEFPEPAHVQPLLDAIRALRRQKEEWSSRWSSDPDGPVWNPGHPLAEQMAEEKRAIWDDYTRALIEIYGLDPARIDALID